jgi:hypothetical protein
MLRFILQPWWIARTNIRFLLLPRRIGGITIKSTPLTVQGIPRHQLIGANQTVNYTYNHPIDSSSDFGIFPSLVHSS